MILNLISHLREDAFESEAARLWVVPAQMLPVQKVGQSLRPISLDNSLPAGLLTKRQHYLRQLFSCFLKMLEKTFIRFWTHIIRKIQDVEFG